MWSLAEVLSIHVRLQQFGTLLEEPPHGQTLVDAAASFVLTQTLPAATLGVKRDPCPPKLTPFVLKVGVHRKEDTSL